MSISKNPEKKNKDSAEEARVPSSGRSLRAKTPEPDQAKNKTRVSKSDRKAIQTRNSRRLIHRQTMADFLLGYNVGAILTIISAHALVLLEGVVQETGIVIRLAHAQSGSRDAVQGVHVLRDRAVVRSSGGHRARGAGVLNTSRGEGHLCGSGLAKVNVGRKLRDFALGFEEARLQVNDVLAELSLIHI